MSFERPLVDSRRGVRLGVLNSLYGRTGVGGAERSVELLADALSERGWEVVVLTSARSDSTENIGRVRVRRLVVPHLLWIGDPPVRQRWRRYAWHLWDSYNPAAFRVLRRVLREERIRVLHTNQLAGLSVTAWTAAHAARIPIVHTLRDYYLLCPRKSMFRDNKICATQCFSCRALSLPRRSASAQVNYVVGISQHVLDAHLCRGYFAGARSSVIPNTLAASAPPNPIPRDGVLRFLYVGLLSPWKGVESLLHEFPNRPNASLAVCGSAPDGRDEALLRSRYSRPGVTFRGVVPVEEALAGADVLVVPSQWEEPFGRVVIEAYAQGCPVISSGRGGLGELVRHGVTGLVYDASQPGALGRAIEQLIADPGLVARMSLRCLRAAEQFRADVVVPQYERVYEEVLGVPL